MGFDSVVEGLCRGGIEMGRWWAYRITNIRVSLKGVWCGICHTGSSEASGFRDVTPKTLATVVI